MPGTLTVLSGIIFLLVLAAVGWRARRRRVRREEEESR